MSKRPAAAVAAPTAIAFGITPASIFANLRVVDAATGEVLPRVTVADSAAGKVTRFAVEDGSLVREGDAFKVIKEDRAIRIEWIDPPAADGEPAGEEG